MIPELGWVGQHSFCPIERIISCLTNAPSPGPGLSASFLVQRVLKIRIPLRIKHFFVQLQLSGLWQGEDMRLRPALNRNGVIFSVKPAPALIPLQGGLGQRLSESKDPRP